MKFFIITKFSSLLVRAYSVLIKIFALLPRNNKLILFESYSGKQFNCNPRAIYEYLHESKDKYDHKLIWSLDKRYLSALDGVDAYLKGFSLKWFGTCLQLNIGLQTADCLYGLHKYLQTWHGTPLKKLANDMDEVHIPGTTTEKYKQNFLQQASKWDYLISLMLTRLKFSNLLCSSIRREISKTGYPIKDILFSSN